MQRNINLKFAHAQQGAALIIGLLLLLVLTILGVSGMNSASLEFMMAGNEQFKNNAFQAAETGLSAVTPDPSRFVASKTVTQFSVTNAAIASSSDTYSAAVAFLGKGGSVSGNTTSSSGSATVLKAYYFTVTATGNSARGAQATNIQGLARIGPDDPSIEPITAVPTISWTPNPSP
jgi:type IV pilus assembly protein PilX